jgi:Ca2+-transporting ATPase
MVTAIEQGRTIYGNIRKAIHFLLATNFSEIEVMLASVALGLGQPLNPMQLLWINLITDIFPGLALALDAPEEDTLSRPPRNPEEPIIRPRDLTRLGIESLAITGGTLASYGYALTRYGTGVQAGTQAFTTLTLAQLLHTISCRSESTSVFGQRRLPPNPYLFAALGGSLLVQLLAAVVPGLRKLLGTIPLGLVDVAVAGAGAVIPFIVNELSKSAGAGRELPPARSRTTATESRGAPSL